jgi:carbonic anhydrase
MGRFLLTGSCSLTRQAAVAVLLLISAFASALPQSHHDETPAVAPKEALNRLVEGNTRFVSGKAKHPRQDAATRKHLTSGQQPFATVLSCSDSRVPPELVFDQGIGDLFVVRVAGNIGGEDDLGSVEYAVEHLNTSLVVVMGHEMCGAVTAALAPDSVRKREADGIQQMLAHVLPSLVGIDRSLPPAEQVHRGVEANVRASVEHLRNTQELREKIASGKLNVVGAVYELETGKVRVLQ